MRLKAHDLALFAVYGTMMYLSYLLMRFLPNIHLLAMFIISFTDTYRVMALIPIYVYVMLTGIFSGFAMWWLPYLYIWTILWAAVIIVPKRIKAGHRYILYIVIGCAHGLLFGTLYAPAQAVMFGLSFKATVAWIIAGLPYDLIHGISNAVVCAVLFKPVSRVMKQLRRAGV